MLENRLCTFFLGVPLLSRHRDFVIASYFVFKWFGMSGVCWYQIKSMMSLEGSCQIHKLFLEFVGDKQAQFGAGNI